MMILLGIAIYVMSVAFVAGWLKRTHPEWCDWMGSNYPVGIHISAFWPLMLPAVGLYRYARRAQKDEPDQDAIDEVEDVLK
jgi:hypothetical protein